LATRLILIQKSPGSIPGRASNLKNMKKIILVFLISFPLFSYSQSADTLKAEIVNERIEAIDSTLREYGKQQNIANKITIVSIASIGIGTLLGVPALPLLVINTAADLTTLIITNRSNKKLAKHKSK
jgi:Na+/H+ antiporter NhaC